MRSIDITQRLQQLRQLIDRTSDASEGITLQGHWGRYLCVVAAGFLEHSLQTVYSEYAQRSASPNVARFVSKQLGRISNPKAERFLQTAGAFNREWRNELSDFLSDDPHLAKDAIDSIMNNRNNIAHGQLANITPARVRDYLDRSVKVLEFIETQCNR